MNLRITTRHGFIGINGTQGKTNISYGKSNFAMGIKAPKIHMDITQPKVKIDQTKPLSEIGQGKVFDLIRSNVKKSKEAIFRAIAKTVQQGNELARIETGRNVIAEQAKDNAFGQSIQEFNIDFIPKSRPEIDLEEGRVEINLEEGDVDIESAPTEVNLDISRGKVEIYLRQKPFIDVEYVGDNLNMSI